MAPWTSWRKEGSKSYCKKRTLWVVALVAPCLMQVALYASPNRFALGRKNAPYRKLTHQKMMVICFAAGKRSASCLLGKGVCPIPLRINLGPLSSPYGLHNVTHWGSPTSKKEWGQTWSTMSTARQFPAETAIDIPYGRTGGSGNNLPSSTNIDSICGLRSAL